MAERINQRPTNGEGAMKHSSDNTSPTTLDADLAWLKNDEPEIYHLLLAFDGDLDALRWLKRRGDGLFLFVEALTGAKEAVDMLQDHPAGKLVDLFDTIAHCEVEEWLRERQPELHALFTYVRGDNAALKEVKHKKVAFKRVAEIVRAKYRAYHEEDADGMASSAGTSSLQEGAAADVGCLIGEMHLRNHEYLKAIEAFSRAIAMDPTPDAYAGRARAYRALAVLDDHAAAQLRERS
jgi:tetratricopeptide (TPR) repeat protein